MVHKLEKLLVASCGMMNVLKGEKNIAERKCTQRRVFLKWVYLSKSILFTLLMCVCVCVCVCVREREGRERDRKTERESERLILFNYRCLHKHLLFSAVIIICCVCLVHF